MQLCYDLLQPYKEGSLDSPGFPPRRGGGGRNFCVRGTPPGLGGGGGGGGGGYGGNKSKEKNVVRGKWVRITPGLYSHINVYIYIRTTTPYKSSDSDSRGITQHSPLF